MVAQKALISHDHNLVIIFSLNEIGQIHANDKQINGRAKTHVMCSETAFRGEQKIELIYLHGGWQNDTIANNKRKRQDMTKKEWNNISKQLTYI